MDKAILDIILRAKDEASAVLKNAGNEMKNAQDKVEGLGKSFAVVGGLMTAGGLMGVAAMQDWMSAASQAEVEMAKFDAKLKASFGETPAVMEKVRQSAEAVSKSFIKLGFDDEETANSFLALASKVKDTTRANELLGVAADLARSKNISLSDATTKLNQVMMGNTRVLKELGISTKDVANENEALALIQQKVSGQAEAYGGTYQGAMDRMKVTTENLKEELGRGLLPVANSMLTKVVDLVDKLNEMNPQLLETIGWVVLGATAFSLIVGPITTIIAIWPSLVAGITAIGVASGAAGITVAGLATALGVIFGIVTIVVAVVALLYLAWQNNFLGIQDITKILWENIKFIFDALVVFFTVDVPIALAALSQVFTDTWNTVSTNASLFYTGLVDNIVKPNMETIKAIHKGDWETVNKEQNKIWDIIKANGKLFYGAMVDNATNSLNTLKGVWSSIWNQIQQNFSWAWETMKSNMTTTWNGIVASIKSGVNTAIGFINRLIDALNGIKIEIPSFDVMGVKMGGFSWGGMNLGKVPPLETGGAISKTGLYLGHAGEYVLSKDMLAGTKPAPSYITNNSQPINVYATINTELDLDLMAYKLAYLVRNS